MSEAVVLLVLMGLGALFAWLVIRADEQDQAADDEWWRRFRSRFDA